MGIFALVGLYGMFAYAGLRIAQNARDRYGKLLAAGLTSMVVVQALVNLLAVFGLAPLTGVPLPFVSYGNASMMVMLAGVGLLLNIAHAPAGARLRVVDESQGNARRIAIAAGGTAGHVVPALAVADALRADGATVSFIGTRDRAEAEVVPAAGYEIDFVDVRALVGRSPARALSAAAVAARAVPAARRILRDRGAGAVLGGGGYVAGPAGLAASSLRLPLVLTEADRHLGLTNRWLARRAARVCLAFPIEGRDGPKYVVTGRPGPGGDRDRRPRRRAAAVRDRGGGPLPARLRRQPGRALDQPLRGRGVRGRRRPRLPRPPHQRPARPRRGREAARRRRPPLHADRLRARASPTRSPPPTSCSPARAARSSRSRRPGGGAILVPYPHAAADHQRANAEWMAEAGAAVVVADGELEPAALRALAGADPRRPLAARGDGRRLLVARPPRRRRAGRRSRCSRRSRGPRERPPTPLHRDRRRRDERAGARLPPPRRDGDRLRPRAERLSRAAARGRASRPGSATTPTPSPPTPRSSSRPRSATTTRSLRGRGSGGSG